jgi:hypothetical protein
MDKSPMQQILIPAYWEEAKGKLQAIEAMYGAYHGGDIDNGNWSKFKKALKAFVREIEDNELHYGNRE